MSITKTLKNLIEYVKKGIFPISEKARKSILSYSDVSKKHRVPVKNTLDYQLTNTIGSSILLVMRNHFTHRNECEIN